MTKKLVALALAAMVTVNNVSAISQAEIAAVVEEIVVAKEAGLTEEQALEVVAQKMGATASELTAKQQKQVKILLAAVAGVAVAYGVARHMEWLPNWAPLAKKADENKGPKDENKGPKKADEDKNAKEGDKGAGEAEGEKEVAEVD